MKEFNEEHIDPEQFWPGAESLLKNHYKAKRRRRAIVFFGAVLVGLLSVYFIKTEKNNLAEKNKRDKKEAVNQIPEQNTIVSQNKFEAIIPSQETEGNKIEDTELKQSPIVENDKEIASVNPRNITSPIKTSTQKSVLKYENKNVVAIVSSGKRSISVPSNSVNVKNSPASSSQANQTGAPNQIGPSRIVQNFDGNTLPIAISNFADVDYISSMPMLKWERKPFDEAVIQHDNRPLLQNKRKAKWDLLVYAGVNNVQKELSGKSSSSYLLRREREEAPVVLPFGGLQLSKSINNWDFRGGVEFAVVGEQVKYSPYSKGDYLSVYDDWVPNNYVVTDTDSAYIWGILFLNTTDYTVIDSVMVTVTDTVNGVYYNSNIRNANGTNRWYVMELPLEVLYQFRMKRWGIGVSVGVAPGLVVQSSGYYLKEDESGYSSIEKYNKQQVTLNARAGIEFSYLLNTRCRLLLRPTSQYSLLKMYAGTNERQRYRRNGISVGLVYMIP